MNGARHHRTTNALALLLIAALWALSRSALALDKQGSAHSGHVEGADTGFGVSGALALGISPYNPTYAARPDNSGHTLMRYALHADVDLIGRRLSIPIDLNLFSDRDRRGALKLVPSELDVIGGLTSTWEVGPGAFEFGVRGEQDRPLDRDTLKQTYVDARARYLYSIGQISPGLSRALDGGDITGWATLGAFLVNPTYAARPDNTGLALMRYSLHAEMSCCGSHLALGLDGTSFTDRKTNAVRPSELDFTPELIARISPFEVHVAYERDMPVDRSGLVQHFVYVLAAWSFDVVEHRRQEPAHIEPGGG